MSLTGCHALRGLFRVGRLAVGRGLAWPIAMGLAVATLAGQGAPAQTVIVSSIGADGKNGDQDVQSGGFGRRGFPVSATNTTSITATFAGESTWFGAISSGGDGGNQYSYGTDAEGHNTYLRGRGGLAAFGSRVNATNDAPITITTNGLSSGGTRLVVALSTGGNGGQGWAYEGETTASMGNRAGSIELTNKRDLNLSWAGWSSNNFGVGAIAVLGSSVGGKGANSQNGGVDGGPGGNADIVNVYQINSTITFNTGSVDVPQANSSFPTPPITRGLQGFSAFPPLVGAVVVASSWGGAGGIGWGSSRGGAGGLAGDASLLLQNTSINRTLGLTDNVAGVLVESTGGRAGNGDSSNADSGGGRGGSSGTITLRMNHGGDVYTNGRAAPVAIAASVAGDGGIGGSTDGVGVRCCSGPGGDGGNAGSVTVEHGGSYVGAIFVPDDGMFSLLSYGSGSPALVAVSFGGSAGAGGSVTGSGEGNAAGGGTGGSGGTIQITTSRAASLTTHGISAPGILAQSIGGNGANGGSANVLVNADGGDGGPAGSAGDVTIILAPHALYTGNDQSPGVIAVSRGGNGGNGGNAASSNSDSGLGGNGGAAGTIRVASEASITTDGAASYGILAQAFAGRGGNAGSAGGVLATASDGGSSGAPGAVTVVNRGTITTSGAQSMGILALSVGGGGGVGGDATGAFSVGGDGGKAANGGVVDIVSAGLVTTRGDLAHGSVAMSIGGGGGSGGNATSYSAVVGVSIGGTAGDGGAGGSVTLSSPGLGATPGYLPGITTYNSNAAGLVGLSVGGGGGTGGAGYTITGSVGFGASVSVGGSGGAGGNGGAVTIGLSNLSVVTGLATSFAIDPATLPDDSTTHPLPVDSYGIVALSVGGGGGIGGSASAKTYVADAPIPSTGVSIALSASYTPTPRKSEKPLANRR